MKRLFKFVDLSLCFSVLYAHNDYKSTIEKTFVYFKEYYQFRNDSTDYTSGMLNTMSPLMISTE